MKCELCNIRESILQFSLEPNFALTHGFGIQNICRTCYIRKIESHIKNCEEQLKEQKILLKEKK